MTADKRSERARQWQRWYKTARWQRRRQMQFSLKPFCEWCEKRGITSPANIAHHAEKHDGDQTKFFTGPLVSLCKACHDGEAQSIERRGYSKEIGEDGWPTDPKHPGYSP
jgi:hypothetical protein